MPDDRMLFQLLDSRLRSALQGLDPVAARSLNVDALMAFNAVLQCAGRKAENEKLYRFRLIVAPSWIEAQRAIAHMTSPPFSAQHPAISAQLYHGLIAMKRTGPEQLNTSSSDVRLCALAHVSPPSPIFPSTFSRDDRIHAVEWRNLFTDDESATERRWVDTTPIYFNPDGDGVDHNGPPFSLAAPTPVAGCVWGVTIIPATTDNGVWPHQWCVCSDLCRPVQEEDASVLEPPYFAFAP